ncbi:hypothetical protein [Streptomyces sp. NPDC058394]|uniref:hypothetical protein n=1 Tax=Streptomyces sp. NPDC058394 TaxID=3346477 RepID=UPI003664BC7B
MSNTELHHLLNRALDGVVLHGESDRLRELVRQLEKRAEQADADRNRVQQRACSTAETLRHAKARLSELEAAIERARKLATQWAILRAYGGAATQLRAALDQPQPTAPTCRPGPYDDCPDCHPAKQQPTL